MKKQFKIVPHKKPNTSPNEVSSPKKAGVNFKAVLITPNDPVFFRDGKPFTMGEEVHTSGVFPPYPSVLQGALRSVYFTHHPESIPIDDETDPTENATFANAALAYNRELLFPLPADLLLVGNEIVPLRLQERSKLNFLSSAETNYKWLLQTNDKRKVDPTNSVFLKSAQMSRYLKGEIPQVVNLTAEGSTMLIDETKVGIGRTPYQVTEEGKLYRMTRKRLAEKLQLYVAFQGFEIPNRGLMAVGSEGTSAHFELLQHVLPLPVVTPLAFNSNLICKLYIMTPAVVEVGKPYIPVCLQDTNIDVLTYATGRPVNIGGWDMKKNAAKPMKQAIPAGSVYFFKVRNKETFDKLMTKNGQSLCENEYAKQGFGIGLFGIQNQSL